MSTNMFILRTGTYFYLLVQLLLQDYFDTIAQQHTLNCKDDFKDEEIRGFRTVKMTVDNNLR